MFDLKTGFIKNISDAGTARVSLKLGLLAAGLLLSADAFSQQTCPVNYAWVAAANSCVVVINKYRTNKPNSVCTGSSICVPTGSFRYGVDFGISLGNRRLIATYDSSRQNVASLAGFSQGPSNFGDPRSFGNFWSSSFHQRLVFRVSGTEVQAFRGDGSLVSFELLNGIYITDPDVQDSLVVSGGNFLYTDYLNRSVETYNGQGQLLSLADASGPSLAFTYSSAADSYAPAAGYLESVKDNFGRQIFFTYVYPGASPTADHALYKITDPSGRNTTILQKTDSGGAGANGALYGVTWPDFSVKGFMYDYASMPWALTSIYDENGLYTSTTDYAVEGAVLSNKGPLGTGATNIFYGISPRPVINEFYDPINSRLYRFHDWQTPSVITVTNASGASQTMGLQTVLGAPRIVSTTNPGGVGDALMANAMTIDLNGNVMSSDDLQGQRTCYAYDGMNRETSVISGLSNAVACYTVVPTGSQLPTGARRTDYQWHPDWPLKTVVTQPGITITTIYHGQTDSVSGGVASCTTAPAFPNGKPLPLTCKVVVQATLLNGAVDPSSPRSVTSFTYDSNGNMLTAVDPAGKSSQNTFYTDTSFASSDPDALGHTIGDRKASTNALGFVTQMTQYDRSGRLRQSINAKGVATDLTYTALGLLATSTVTPPRMPAMVEQYFYDKVRRTVRTINAQGLQTTKTYLQNNALVRTTDAKNGITDSRYDSDGHLVTVIRRGTDGCLFNLKQITYDITGRVQKSAILAGGIASFDSSLNRSALGSAVQFNVLIFGLSPTGTVVLKDGSTVLGSAAIGPVTSNCAQSMQSTATITSSSLTVGNHNITVEYSGDANNPAIKSDVYIQSVVNPNAPFGTSCGSYTCY